MSGFVNDKNHIDWNFGNEEALHGTCVARMEKKKTNLANEDEESEDLTYGEMFKGLARSISLIARSGIKITDNMTHEQRYTICKGCEWLSDSGRCKKCGCFMKLKSRFAAMSCPIGKWGA